MNADSSDCLGIRGIVSYNLFAYCGNEPVNNIDEQGNLIGTIIKNIVLGLILGLTKQFFSDIIQWVYTYLILNKNSHFKPSKSNEYLSSILVEIGNQFLSCTKKAKAALYSIVEAIGIAVKYLSKIIGNKMKTRDWINFVVSIAALVLSYVLRSSSTKLKNQRNQINKKLKKWKKQTIKNKSTDFKLESQI